jgi:NADH:ubiquinone oxidoreductase subunit F (NADH-binding)/NAD-dependent dihydropyrimidine dehydrogenase PreA subunit
MIKNIADLQKIKDKGLKKLYPPKMKIMVGMATCGLAAGAEDTYNTIMNEIKKNKLDADVVKIGCIGWCCKEPLVDVLIPGLPRITFAEVSPKKATVLIEALSKGKIPIEEAIARIDKERNLIADEWKKYSSNGIPEEIKSIAPYEELSLFKNQVRIVMRNCGYIDPMSIEQYIAKGGYFSLHKVLSRMKPEDVIDEVTKSGIRGRGGAGFPTGIKWKITREQPGNEKYVICNADEGDPGAYMDRSILEGDPHSVLEGMIIGAYAIGAKKGYIYVRTEYPLAIKTLLNAIKQAEDLGLLGENIFNSGFNFRIKLARGAGAFVCGEETSLIASIEGKIGEPRPRPPFPAQCGLWGKPTNINNVETWANIPVIIARGAKWFSNIGTENSKGTKVFSLVGKVNNTSLVEVPMGIKLEDIIYEVGEGIPNNKKFKAIQTGGPSGGCIPENLINLPVDYDTLTKAGAIMGSGGMIVMDENTCMVDVAKYFLSFLEDESCGKCVPCREGIRRMRQILSNITEGKGKEGDIELLEELAKTIKGASLCGLGQTAPNPVLTTIRYFRDEYEAHIKDKRCPAGACTALITYAIDAEKCTGCARCIRVCPQEAISGEVKQPHTIDKNKCIKCGACYEVCNFDAIIRT